MITILKFFGNTNKQNETDDNEVISRTMLKIAVVSRHYKQQPGAVMPKHGEIWRCKIVKEISNGLNKGCFVVEPLAQIQAPSDRPEESSLVRLVPGLFCRKLIKGRLIILPKKPGYDWILPLTIKRIMAEEFGAYSVIVQLDASPEDLRDCERLADSVKASESTKS